MVGVAIAAGAFVIERQKLGHLDNVRFEQLIHTASDRVRERMAIYTNALRAGASMYQASERVTRSEWRDFAASMELVERYPGVLGLGLIVPVQPDRLQEFLVWERFDGAPNLELKSYSDAANPRGPSDEHFIVLYLEPAARNGPYLGIDMSSEPARRAAATKARDTGLPAITTQVPLFQDALRRPGFLYFLPVYEGRGPITTVEERRTRFRGLVFAPFRTADFFRSALGDLSDRSMPRSSRGVPPTRIISCFRRSAVGRTPRPVQAGARWRHCPWSTSSSPSAGTPARALRWRAAGHPCSSAAPSSCWRCCWRR
jgi:CHASE1-domain containing sensor protein